MSRLGANLEIHDERRLRVLIGLVLVVFAGFGLRLFQLQVVEGDEHRLRSERNRIRTIRLEAPRGKILDRDGRELATWRPAFALQVIPDELVRSDVTFSVLGELLGTEAAGLEAKLAQGRGSRGFRPVVLDPDLGHERLARVESHRFALPGVTIDIRPGREYPEGRTAAHLLGTIGEVSERQLATRDFADYRAGDVVGQRGIEQRFEAHLRGKAGGRNVVVDVTGREVEVLDEVRPRPGGNVFLALDLDLQRDAEQAFRPADAGPDDLRPHAGVVVALDPRNGDVLAMVSRPAFDPNWFVGIREPEHWQAMLEDPRRPLHHRAVAGQYPPGSLYKAVVGLAGMEEGVIEEDTRFFCPGFFVRDGRRYHCWKRPGHGWVDLHRAVVESCDVFFYETGLRLGIDRLHYFARAFHLGRRFGLPIGGEASGLAPSSAWKERRFGERWVPGETVSASIGQGFNLATPLQMAVAYSALANGGRVMAPRLALRRTLQDGESVVEEAPRVLGRLPVSAPALERMRAALVAVVNAPGGTGRRAAVADVTVAGKTGTAQVVGLEHTEEADRIPESHRDHAWFAAFAPAEAPEIVVVVLVEHGGSGGATAAPIAGRLLAGHFTRASDTPEDGTESGPPGDGRIAARSGEEGPRASD